MSLYKFSQFASIHNKLSVAQRGKVVDNNDPKKLGRIKCEIKGIFEGDKSKFPWVYPKNPSKFGGHPKTAEFVVPRIGSFVSITFHNASIYHPFYGDYLHHENNYAMEPFKENYPNRYGTVDPTGNAIVHDMKTHKVTYTHVAQDDDQNSDPVDDSDKSSTSKFKAGMPAAPPKLKFEINGVGDFAHTSIGNLLSDITGGATHKTGKDFNVSSAANVAMAAIENITHGAKGDILQNALGSITHGASEKIVNIAKKIFLN